MENLAERIAKGEVPTPEDYEANARERQVPVEIQVIKSVYGVPCEHCKSTVTVFECALPDIKRKAILCLRCQDKIKSKALPLTEIGNANPEK